MPDVVTAFLRHRGEVLLLRRSDAVGTYAGQWGGVSGYVEPDTDDTLADARRELREEVGAADPTLVRAGVTLAVGDDDREWTVHPFLFETDDRAVEPNEEVAEWEWVAPPEMRDRDTVPGLWAGYRLVGPTPATVAGDDEHGSAYISARALEALRDAAAERREGSDEGESVDVDVDQRDLAAVADDLRNANPAMTALTNRLNRVLGACDAGDVDCVVARAHEALDEALDADDTAAAQAASLLPDRLLTLSRSGTALAAIREAEPSSVMVAESRPGGEGVAVARELRAADVDATPIPDAAVAHHVASDRVAAAVVGADAVGPDGRVVNKVGTRGLALACEREGVPLYVVAAGDKVVPAGEWEPELGDANDVVADDFDADDTDPAGGDDADDTDPAGGDDADDTDPAGGDDADDTDPAGGDDADDLPLNSPMFDVVPADCEAVTVVTEDGPLAEDALAGLAADHRGDAAAAATWE